MNYRKYIVVIMIGVLIMSGCNQNETFECFDTPPDSLDESSVENWKDLDLYFARGEKTEFMDTDVIPIFVRNLTNHDVWMPRDYNLLMYYELESGERVYITDDVDREFVEDDILGPKGTETSTRLFLITPDFQAPEKLKLKISVWGVGFRNGQYCTDQFGGEIEVTIIP